MSFYSIGDDMVDEIDGDDVEALLGQEYLIGDDEIDIGRSLRVNRGGRSGRGMTRRKLRGGAMRQAVARRLVRDSTLLRERQPTKSRLYPLGFDSVTPVAAAATVNIISRPQVPFKPERLVLSTASAPAYLINDIVVGKNSQFAATGALPGDAFRPDAVDVSLQCDTAQVSGDVALNVTNVSAGALRFNAVIFGEAVE